MSEIPKVLFVCVHNAGRGHLAAALLDRHAQGRVPVRSLARPVDEVCPIRDGIDRRVRGRLGKLLNASR